MRDSRYNNYLRSRYVIITRYIGAIILLIGLLLLVPLALLVIYPDEADEATGFLAAGVPLIALGALMSLWARPVRDDEPVSLSVQEGALIVLVVWLAAVVFGSIPFMVISGLTFTQAVFESTSGWTTTGLSVVDVTAQPRLILFYRSFIQLAGGAGIAILVLSALAGPAGAGLSMAEGRSDQLAPHVRRSANIVLRIYIGYAVFGILAYRVAGMGWFDAVNHSFTSIATGGFSTRPESIGYWDSAFVEAVCIVLMMLGALNFLTAYTFVTGKFRPALRNGEIRLVMVVLPIAIVALLLGVTLGLYGIGDKAFRTAIFEATSALTGTGFGTVAHSTWTDFGWLVLIGLMTLGGGTGSTAGGLKQFRVYILYKSLVWEFRRMFMPQHMVNEPAIWQGDHRNVLNDRVVRQVTNYVFVYILFLFVGTCIIALHGYSVGESLFEFASTLGTVGLSVGITAPDAPETLLWTQIFGMFFGRLEFFAVIGGLLKIIVDVRVLRQALFSRAKGRGRAA